MIPRCDLSSIALSCFVYTQRCIIEEVCRQISTSGGISFRPAGILLLSLMLFYRKLSKFDVQLAINHEYTYTTIAVSRNLLIV